MKIISFLKKIIPKGVKRGIVIIISIPFFIAFVIRRKFIHLRWFSSDINVFYHTFIEQDFFISKKKMEGINYIIDAGANTGLTALYFHYKFPSAKIIAVEPEHHNFELLKKNTKKEPNIIPLRRGIWYKDAFLKISNPSGQSWSFTTEEVDENQCDVKAVSIPTICKDFEIDTIDFLKIDIEGAEKELFEENVDAWLPRTKFIAIELHGPYRNKMVPEVLKKYKFSLIHINGENQYYQNTTLN